MCGILAYIGPNKKAPQLVIEGLKSLEYRGYDSWGVAYKTGDQILVHKEVGKIGEQQTKKLKFPPASLAIGHSRWATHGKVNLTNSHPHHSENKEIVLVHNGVVENYLDIKKRLQKKGYKFHTQTDTEVIANLIEDRYRNNFEVSAKAPDTRRQGNFDRQTRSEAECPFSSSSMGEAGKSRSHATHSTGGSKFSDNAVDGAFAETFFTKAIQSALRDCEGRYAIVAINKHNNEIVAARKGSPLIVGIGKNRGEYFIASDIPAFLKHTNKIMYLDDNQLVKIANGKIEFFDTNTSRPIEKRVIEIDLDAETAEKGEFPHFMIKEIMEQKDSLVRTINQETKIIEKVAAEIKKAFGTYFIGCGTAGKVAMVGEYLFAKIAKKHINACFGSEFSNHKDFLTKKSLLVAISQSGETADTLEAVEIAKEKEVKIVSIVNVESSTMARVSNIVIPIKAGPEKAVASTKATTSQIAILTLLAHACDGGIKAGKQLLINTASQINDMINPRYEDHIMKIAKKIRDVESMYIIGRGLNYPIALESAIKLQEVSYIHAEGFAGGELKHGPLALITKNTPVIVLVANDETKKDILTNAEEIKARGGYIIGVSPERHEVFDYWIRVPDTGFTSPIVNIIPIQILAYQLAVLRENDPDKPRNLAKSVTVK